MTGKPQPATKSLEEASSRVDGTGVGAEVFVDAEEHGGYKEMVGKTTTWQRKRLGQNGA